MGGTISTDSTATAVPFLSKVWQNMVLLYHVLVKILRCRRLIHVNLTYHSLNSSSDSVNGDGDLQFLWK